MASVLLVSSGFSQEVAATISGTVTDSSGAVVGGAKVVIHRVDTDTDERTVTTDNSGNYVATNIPPSTYVVTVTSPGFKAYTTKNVTLNVSQKLNVSAKLVPGAATETVTVEENPVALQTETAAQSTTITGTQVRELELNNRNFQQLVTLQPGVVNNLGDEPGYGLNSTTDVSVNGVRGTGNNWTVDGADINDSGSNGTLLNIPSVDAIQEFTLERSQYDASFGRSAGAQVIVATKAGTREFHGDMYEFARNDAFNANTFLANASDQPRAVERYNNFGFTLGGPLYIPKVYNTNKDKTYFFWSEEWRKVSSPNTIDIPAASTAMLGGLVSGQVTSPISGCAVYTAASNTTQISPACFSANANVYIANILSKFPANNAVTDAAGGNYISTYSALNNFRQDIVRFDYDITSKLKFYARYMKDTIPSNVPTGLWGGNNFPGVVNVALEVPGTNAVGNLSYVISPSMVNEFEFAYSEGGIESALSGPAVDQSIISQLTNNFAYKDPYNRLPSINITGYTGVSEGSSPYHEANLDRNIFDNFTWTLHNHTLRAGATAQWMLKSENSSGGDSAFTFNTFGDFLLGNVALYQQGDRDIIPDLRYRNFEAYVQDDWKVTPRLTLNLGLRYSYFPGPSDHANTLSNFSPALFDATKAPELDGTGSFVAGQSVIPSTYTNGLFFPTGSACTQAQAIAPLTSCSPYGSGVNPNSNLNFAPRVGFAYTVDSTGRTVFRGGFGIFYDRTLNGMWEQNAFTNPPLVQQAYIQNTTFDNPLGVSGVSLGPQPIETTGTPTLKVPSYNTYNLSVQQAIDRATTFEIAYVGSAGRHLLGEVDRNQPTLGARVADPDVNVNDVRPYLGYSYIKNRFTGFTSNYNSLQLSISHHVANGLTIGAAYTWSRTLADAEADRDIAANNTYNLHDSYGPTSFNEPQIFVANYVYDLPFYKEQHGLVGHVLGGWEVSGITTIESGMSNTITQSNDPFACPTTDSTTGACTPTTDPDTGAIITPVPANTYPGGLGMGTSGDGSVQIRADQLGPVHLTKKLNPAAGVNEWVDTSKFAVASGHFGSSRVGSVYGPGEQNWDIGAMKNVKFAERYSLQIRGEFFNAFNHTNPSGFDTNISDTTFGQVTATHNPREIQLGAKLYF